MLQCVAVCCSANPLSTLQVRSLALNGFAIKKEGKKALTNERKKDRKKDRQKDNKERKNQCECRVLSTFISRSRAPFRRDVALFRISSALFRINFAFIYLLGCWHEAIEQLQCVCVCVCGRVCVRKRECVRVHSILTYCDTPPPPPLHTTHRRVRDRSCIWVCSNYPGVEACRFQAIQRQRRTLGPLALEPPCILVL